MVNTGNSRLVTTVSLNPPRALRAVAIAIGGTVAAVVVVVGSLVAAAIALFVMVSGVRRAGAPEHATSERASGAAGRLRSQGRPSRAWTFGLPVLGPALARLRR
jgi:uncharacterized sodium:solute symporter family permease YidK